MTTNPATATLLPQDPRNLAEAFADLLESDGLDSIAEALLEALEVTQ